MIIRSRQEKFTIIPNVVACDKRLSLEARAILVYLLSKPTDWKITIKDIQNQGSIGRDKAYRIVRELADVGYLVSAQGRCEKGTFESVEYILYDLSADGQPLTENPYTDYPDTDNQKAVQITNNGIFTNNRIFNNNKNNINNNNNNLYITRAREDFLVFWKKYPHKVGKPPAERAFSKALKKHGLDAIMKGLEFYISTKPAERQWLNPATFLNQERYLDEPATATKSASKSELITAAMRDLKAEYDL